MEPRCGFRHVTLRHLCKPRLWPRPDFSRAPSSYTSGSGIFCCRWRWPARLWPALLWPGVLPLRFALEVSYRIILLTAAIALIRARKGRWEFWAWLLATCLLVQHLSWPPFTDGIPARLVVASDVLLGLSMLLVAFGEARARTQRLRVLGVLTDSIVRAQQQSGMMETALI